MTDGGGADQGKLSLMIIPLTDQTDKVHKDILTVSKFDFYVKINMFLQFICYRKTLRQRSLGVISREQQDLDTMMEQVGSIDKAVQNSLFSMCILQSTEFPNRWASHLLSNTTTRIS